MQRITIAKKSALLSENGNYIVREGEKHTLWVRPTLVGKKDPHYCLLAGSNLTYNGVKYAGYTPIRAFLRDCLHTAEEIINNKVISAEDTKTYSRAEAGPFGKSHAENIELARAMAGRQGTGGNARPGLREAYVIVSTDEKSTYPYHAAAVVAVDGDDAVTLEVFAGGRDARDDDRRAPGEFNMYAGAGADSFHTVWSSADVFAGAGPVTFVIRP